MAHQELGAELMERVAVDTAHLGKPDVIPKVEETNGYDNIPQYLMRVTF